MGNEFEFMAKLMEQEGLRRGYDKEQRDTATLGELFGLGDAEYKPAPVYMVVKDGGPLYQKDLPLFFETEDSAAEEMYAFSDPEQIVAEIEPATVVKRLTEGGISSLAYVRADGTRFQMPVSIFGEMAAGGELPPSVSAYLAEGPARG